MRFLFLFTTFFITTLFGAQHSFVLQDVDSNQFLVQEGDTSLYTSPYCSFNIVLSLIGFDTGILQDTENPLWPYQDVYEEEYLSWNDRFPEKWRAAHNPTSWMQNSCIWYSQALTQKFGMKTFADYVAAFNYGNQNLTGGLTFAWIGSSLRISPLEQVRFISKLVKQELPVSKHAHESTKAILFKEELPNGMKLYGKTGGGDFGNGRDGPSLRVGWFVGWAEKGNRRFAFAYRIHGTEPGGHISGTVATEKVKQALIQLPM